MVSMNGTDDCATRLTMRQSNCTKSSMKNEFKACTNVMQATGGARLRDQTTKSEMVMQCNTCANGDFHLLAEIKE
jgi:hypothetical protein